MKQFVLAKSASVEQFIERALADLPKGGHAVSTTSQSVFEQGLGLFGSPEDASLLDDVVALVYEERGASKREPTP